MLKPYNKLLPEKHSLLKLMGMIDMGMIDTSSGIDHLKMVSDKYPTKFVKVIEVYIDEYLIPLREDNDLTFKTAETNYYSFVMFDTSDDKLSVMSLMELFTATKELEEIEISFTDNDWLLLSNEEPE